MIFCFLCINIFSHPTYSITTTIVDDHLTCNYRDLKVVNSWSMGQDEGDWIPYSCCNRTQGHNVVEEYFCIDNTFHTAFKDTEIADDSEIFLQDCTTKMNLDVSYKSPEKNVPIQCTQLCCGNSEPYRNYPTRITLRSNSTVKLSQAIAYIEEHALYVIPSSRSEYERMFYKNTGDELNAEGLTTLQGYGLIILFFFVLIAICSQFQKETQRENRRNKEQIQDSYQNEGANEKEKDLLKHRALHRMSSPAGMHVKRTSDMPHGGYLPAVGSPIRFGKSRMNLGYKDRLRQGTLFGLGGRLDEDEYYHSETDDESSTGDDEESVSFGPAGVNPMTNLIRPGGRSHMGDAVE